MSRKKGVPLLAVEQKVRIVLAVLGGELSEAEAARRHGVSGQTVARWRERFVECGTAGLDHPRMPGPNGKAGDAELRRVRAENEQLKLAVVEATVQVRIWRKGAEHVDRVRSSTSKH